MVITFSNKNSRHFFHCQRFILRILVRWRAVPAESAITQKKMIAAFPMTLIFVPLGWLVSPSRLIIEYVLFLLTLCLRSIQISTSRTPIQLRKAKLQIFSRRCLSCQPSFLFASVVPRGWLLRTSSFCWLLPTPSSVFSIFEAPLVELQFNCGQIKIVDLLSKHVSDNRKLWEAFEEVDYCVCLDSGACVDDDGLLDESS